MYVTIMSLDNYLDYPNTAVHQVCLRRDYKFMSCLNKSRNTLIIVVLGTDIRWKSRIRRQWVKSLYIQCNHTVCMFYVSPVFFTLFC